MPWFSSIRTLVDLSGPDSPGAQPFPSFAGTPSAPKTAAYTASFGETVYVDPTVTGTFSVTLPLITSDSRGSRIRIVVVSSPAVGGATPQNITVTPNALNGIGGAPINVTMLLSGRSVLELESDGGTNWIINKLPACPSTPATLTDGDQTISRLGPYTRYQANAATAAGRTFTFSNTNAVSGDIIEISQPTHGANTITIRDATPATIATFPATVANGGRFIYNGSAWVVLMGGNSST